MRISNNYWTDTVPRLLSGTGCAALMIAIAGCGGSGGGATVGTTAGGTNTGGSVNSGPAVSVFVVQQPAGGTGTILQFSATASGSVAPTATITPGLAGVAIGHVATDQLGDVYLATPQDVREYASGATGNATPIRSLPSNSTTGIYGVDGLAVSPTGDIVLGQDGGDVDLWSATQNGSVAPTRRVPGYSQTGGSLSPVVVANQVAIDGNDNIYIAPEGLTTVLPPAVVVYGPTANGTVSPTRTITGSGLAAGLTVDSTGNIYTTSESNCTVSGASQVCSGVISVYASNATTTSAPVRTISGSATLLASVWGIEVDSVGNIYVVSTANNVGTSPSVLKFAATASGNAAPVSSFTSTAWTTPDFNPSLAIH